MKQTSQYVDEIIKEISPFIKLDTTQERLLRQAIAVRIVGATAETLKQLLKDLKK